jgi:hypothetical protein
VVARVKTPGLHAGRDLDAIVRLRARIHVCSCVFVSTAGNGSAFRQVPCHADAWARERLSGWLLAPTAVESRS